MIATPRHPGWPEVIDALQHKARLTQRQIESRTGISQSFLSNLKAGRRTSIKFEAGLRLFVLYLERVQGVRLVLK